MQDVETIKGRGLIEPSSGGGAAVAEASVMVVTKDGKLVEAGDYVLDALAHGRVMKRMPPAFLPPSRENQGVGSGRLSEQVQDTLKRATKYALPRVQMSDLLLFYDLNVWHRRSVALKAVLVGGLGWQLVRGEDIVFDPKQHGGVPVGLTGEDERAVRLLVRPNEDPLESFDELMFRWLVDFGSQGNAYLEVARDRRKRPAAFYHAPARTMRRDARYRGYWQVKRLQEQRFEAFGTGQGTFGKNEILHLYEYDPLDDYYGVPAWFAALATMGMDRVLLEYNLRLFANSLMAHVAVIVEGGKLSKEGREAVKQFIQDQAMGVQNAGKVLLIEDEHDRVKIKFEKLNLDVKDLMTTKPQEWYRDVVVSAHGVPPRLLGIVVGGQLGGAGEISGQLQIFRETVLRPMKHKVERLLGALLEEVSPGLRVRFHEMDITDLKADGEFWSKMIKAGVYKAEEARAVLDRMRA